jgi:hypothetical protein
MSTTSVLKRSQMLPMAEAVRAYVMPVDRNTGAVSPFDPALQGQFDLDHPPAPFIDLGWVENLQRSTPTKYEALRTGPRGAVSTQYRAQSDALLDFDLAAWGKVQMALAGGAQQLNVLATDQHEAPQGSGGIAVPAVYLQDGATSTELPLLPPQLEAFQVGDLVAVDTDYTGTAGYLGAGTPGTYLATPLDAASHVDLIRRVTFNVARVVVKTPLWLEVAPALPATPNAGFGVQKVVALVDREGGSYFQEWSGLFVVDSASGGRVCFYYPRLQVAAGAAEKRQDFATPMFTHMLHAKLRALPTVDPNDGETVLCYRSYFPPASAGV